MIPMGRIKGILLNPQSRWQSVKDEQPSATALCKQYAAPLAAIGPVASLPGVSLIGNGIPPFGQIRSSVGADLVSAAIAFVMAFFGKRYWQRLPVLTHCARSLSACPC